MTASDRFDDPAVRRPPAPPTWAAGTRLAGATSSGPEPVPVAAVQGTLALDLRGCLGMPETPELGELPAGRTETEDLQVWAARFAQAVVEVLGGDRPLSQLLRWTTACVYAELDRRVRIVGRTTVAGQRIRTVRPQVRSVHVCRPTQAAAEISVHVRHGQRSRALAARLEFDEGRWRCSALQLG